MGRPKGSKNLKNIEEEFLKRCLTTPCKYPQLDNCWIWIGAVVIDNRRVGGAPRPQCNGNTYGTRSAHQWACHHWNKSPLPVGDGMCIRHKCDTPLCVNPAHLQYGSSHENFIDMVERNPASLGRIEPTEDDLAKLRECLINGKTIWGIYRLYPDWSATWIRRIIRDYNIV